MTQQHLIDHVITATGLSRGAATKAVHTILQGITIALDTVSVAARPAREGRNP